MFKIPFFVIFTLIFSVAHARSLKLTHAEFVHLTESQKNEWVIKTMELMVELESRYQREVRTSNLTPERLEHYTRIIKKIQSFLMNDAYADSGRSWESYGQNFANLLRNSQNGKSCIYAGWVSKVVNQNGRGLCLHPNFTGNSSPEARAYAKGSQCEGRNKITCNPAIFGFKSEGTQSLFCVNAGLNEAHNSSYNCMKEALAEAENSDRDSKEVRLRNLRNRLSQHPAVFEEVQKFIFQTCLCETSSKLNEGYHKYMRPHRTCYGLMEMLGATACEEPKIDFDTTFFTKLREFTNGRIMTSNSGSEVDSLYTNYLNEIKNSSADEYARLCPGSSGVTIDNDNSGGDTPGTTIPGGGAEIPPVIPEVPTLPVVEVKAQPATYECKKALCKSSATSASSTEAAAAPSEDSEATEGATTEAVAETPSSAYTCEFEIISKIGDTESVVTPSTKPTEVPTASDVTTLAIKASFDDKTEELSCPVTFEEVTSDVVEEDGVVPTIKLTLKDKTVATQKVVAEVENREGYKVIWFRKGFPEDDKAKPKDPPKPKGQSGLASDSESDEPEAEVAEEPKEEEIPSIPGSEDKLELEEPLKAKSYETCAKLVAEGKPSSEESCVTIPKVSTPATQGQGGLNQPTQPMQQPRGTTNTSALGIR